MSAQEDEPTLPTNPAARLYSFIQEFTDLEDRHRTSKASIADIYSLDLKDTPALVKTLQNILSLPSQIRGELSRISDLNTHPFLQVINQLENALTYLTLNDRPGIFTNHISPELSGSLSMISSVLEKDAPSSELSDAQKEDIINQVNDLHKEIATANFDEEFKLFVTDKLEAISYAVKNYDLVGTATLINRVDQLFGGLLRQAPSVSQDSKKVSLSKKLFALGAGILMVLQITNQGLQLEQSFNAALAAPTTSQKSTEENISPTSQAQIPAREEKKNNKE